MGKRDTADAIRYFLNRYRAEVLGEPVAFEERGRAEPYTFVGDVTSLRIDGEEVDADISDLRVEVDPPSIEDMLDEVRRIRERRSFRKLANEAATKMKVLDPVGIDDFRDLVERLRREGYGGAPEYDPSAWVDVTYDTSGTVFVCGSRVDDVLRDDATDYAEGLGLTIDGVPVLMSPHAPEFEAVLVDTEALAPRLPPFEPADPKDPRFEVRDPRGIAALEWVEGGR